jgi:hypothetical protein
MQDDNESRSSDDGTGDRLAGFSRRGVLKAGAILSAGGFLVGLGDRAVAATETDPSNLDLYLLFGQSNMEGQGTIEPQDRKTNPRIHVLADMTCPNLGREYGHWYLAEPPLNRCYGKLGPGDYFAKTMIKEMPRERSIGLVPAAVSGADIALFQKGAPIGRNNRNIPSQFDGGYQWMLDLAKKAQRVGTFKGILFHQGETNTGDQQWKYQVQGIVENLRSDLGIGNVPFLAGEMLYAKFGGCCASHNSEVNELPGLIPNAHVVSAAGLEGQDYAHFTTEAYRELGRRYAEEMLKHVDFEDGGNDGGGGGDGGGGDGGSTGDFVAEIDPSTTSAGVGDLVQFHVNDTSGSGTWITGLEWDLGNGTTSSGWYADQRYQSAGTYTVSLTATDSEGTSTTHEVTVTIS